MGYFSEYRKNSHTREVFRMIIALAFVPFEKLTIEYDKLDIFIKNKSEIYKITDFWEYFKNTYGKYILKKDTDISIYSYKFWSVHERVLKDLNKTNNALESWNRSLNSNIYQKNPSIYEIGNVLRNQHAIVENKMSKMFIYMINGKTFDKKKSYK
ncbi:hypothetical protein DMUE_1895 [Dictyocoela muelleri]|nr:hypothetical protein DMUE_1895 [Dictyocoela muelleri]